MPVLIDMTDQRFARLHVLAMAPREVWREGQAEWICTCECGGLTIVRGNQLRLGRTTSCGCWGKQVGGLRSFTHGHGRRKERHPAYSTWANMLSRCRNPNHPSYRYYGAQGVSVCERWLTYENFFEDMGERPAGTSLGRFADSGNYEPGNCRWMTPREHGLEQRRKRSQQ